MAQLSYWNIPYAIIAVALSLFYGWKAVKIFKANKSDDDVEKLDWSWKLHQSWLNFAGSIVGWLVLWVMFQKFLGCISDGCTVVFGAWDFIGYLIAFIGVTGYLPAAVVGFVGGLGSLGSKISELVSKHN